jgi:hypothetical protein
MTKFLKTFFFALPAAFFFFFIIAFKAKADNMSSDNYQIQMGNFNMMSGSKSSSGYQMLDTGGQTAPGEYTSAGFIVKAGFIYIKTLIPFSFSISDTTIDFGTLTSQTPATQTTDLTVSAGGAGGYQVIAYENHPLEITTGSTQIPDTTCNGGAETCDEQTAALWDLSNKYGFGFNASGDDIPADFTDSDHFRQFADNSIGETPQAVMESEHAGSQRQSTITFKINISGIQASGIYQTGVVFICTPAY